MINLDSKKVLSEDASILPEFDTIEAAIGESVMEINEQALYENEANWNAIETYIEQRQLQEAANGQDYLLTEGFVGDFFNQVKDWIVALYRKAVALFKKFISMMDSFMLSDKEFVKKYSGELAKTTIKDSFKFKGFKYTISKADLNLSAMTAIKDGISTDLGVTLSDSGVQVDAANLEKAKKSVAGYSDDSEGAMEKFTAKIYKTVVAGSAEASMTTKEFRDNLYEVLRDGEKNKVTLEDSDISVAAQLSIISNYKDQKKTAENNMKAIKKMCDEFTKMCDKLQTSLASAEKDRNTSAAGSEERFGQTYQLKVKVAHIACSYGKKLLTLSQTANATMLSALKAENRQAKAICVKVLTQGKEAFKEEAEPQVTATLSMPKLI
jgi:hypothetical protein